LISLKEKVKKQELEISELINERIQLEHKVFSLVDKLSQQERILHNINSELYEIRESTAWKLVQKLWKIRLWLAPIGSKRDVFGKKLKDTLFGRKYLGNKGKLETNYIQNSSLNNNLIEIPREKDYQNLNIEYYDNFCQIRRKNLEKFLVYVEKQFPECHSISHIFFLPLFSIGGAEKVARNFIKFLNQNYPKNSVILVISDQNLIDSGVNLEKNVILLNLEEFLKSNDRHTKKKFIFDMIKLIRPSVIHNINSSIMWEIIIEKGQELKNISKIFANIFAFQFDENGEKIGFAATYLRGAYPYLSGIFSDNKRFIDEAIMEYKLHDFSKKSFTIYTPSQTVNQNDLQIIFNRLDYYPDRVKQKERLKSVWAGRFDEEKRWTFFLSLVEKAKNTDFEVFGKSVIDKDQRIPQLPNFQYRGVFISSKDVFLENDYDVFIFTSKWEGLPNILLDAGLFGIPIIAPVVGGVLELVNEKTGFPLKEKPSLVDYLQALETIKNNPEEAAQRAKNMVNLILERHTWTRFSQEIKNIQGYVK